MFYIDKGLKTVRSTNIDNLYDLDEVGVSYDWVNCAELNHYEIVGALCKMHHIFDLGKLFSKYVQDRFKHKLEQPPKVMFLQHLLNQLVACGDEMSRAGRCATLQSPWDVSFPRKSYLVAETNLERDRGLLWT